MHIGWYFAKRGRVLRQNCVRPLSIPLRLIPAPVGNSFPGYWCSRRVLAAPWAPVMDARPHYHADRAPNRQAGVGPLGRKNQRFVASVAAR